MSSAFWINDLKQAEILQQKEMGNVKLYMDTGDSEIDPDSAFSDVYIDSNRMIASLVDVELHIIEGGIHNELSWASRFNEILLYLEEQ